MAADRPGRRRRKTARLYQGMARNPASPRWRRGPPGLPDGPLGRTCVVLQSDHSSVVDPPAAAIFSLALPENALALTCTATVISPLPRTLTGWPTADRALLDQIGDADGATLGEQRRDLVQVHDLELDPERVLEAAQLGHPHVQGHLPALEVLADVVAGLGALGATTGGLALGALAATHAGLGGLGARSRTEVMNLQRHVTPPPRRRPDGTPWKSCPGSRDGLRAPPRRRSSSDRGYAACRAGSACCRCRT